MAGWKNNKMLGIIAAVIIILCFVFIIKGILSMIPPKAPSVEEQVRQQIRQKGRV